MAGYFSLDEPAECNARRRGAQTRSECAPRVIAHLDSRHAITRRLSWRPKRRWHGSDSRPWMRLPFSLSSAASHAVCNVYGAADALERVKLCAASGAQRPEAAGGHFLPLELLRVASSDVVATRSLSGSSSVRRRLTAAADWTSTWPSRASGVHSSDPGRARRLAVLPPSRDCSWRDAKPTPWGSSAPLLTSVGEKAHIDA